MALIFFAVVIIAIIAATTGVTIYLVETLHRRWQWTAVASTVAGSLILPVTLAAGLILSWYVPTSEHSESARYGYVLAAILGLPLIFVSGLLITGVRMWRR